MSSSSQRAGGRDLEAAQCDFVEARFSEAVARLRPSLPRARSADAVLLVTRALLKSDAAEALAVVESGTSLFRSKRHRAEAALLRGIAYVRLGDAAATEACFSEAQRLAGVDPSLERELIYERASAAWVERRLDAAVTLLDELDRGTTDASDLSLRARILRGAIHSAREDLVAQGAVLLEARNAAAAASTLSRAVLTSQLASLAVELPSDALRDAAAADLPSIRWTSDIANLRFETLRSLAWRYALDGDEFGAFRMLKDALTATHSTAWRVAALADRCSLAAALGERRWAAQERRDAYDLAATVDWRTVDGEEKLALPQLAELFADHDPTVAIGYVSTFLAVGKHFSRVLSSNDDVRVFALESYSLGCVKAALGQNAESVRLLRQAYDVYERMGIRWRAARACLKLAELEDRDAWLKRARVALACYPRSWLSRAAAAGERRASASTPELEKLTAAQRKVFDELLDGRDTREIATRLGRSTFTVRNHIKAIFKAFDVSSRPALLARAAATVRSFAEAPPGG